MAKELDSFVASLAAHLAKNAELINAVAAVIGGQLGHGGGGGGRGRRAGKAPAPKKGGGRKGGGARGGGTGATERVLAAIRGGADKRSDIISKSGVSSAGYKYALKVLSSKGMVKVHGNRGSARVTAS